MDILIYYLKQMGVPEGIDEESNLYIERIKNFIKDTLKRACKFVNL